MKSTWLILVGIVFTSMVATLAGLMCFTFGGCGPWITLGSSVLLIIRAFSALREIIVEEAVDRLMKELRKSLKE